MLSVRMLPVNPAPGRRPERSDGPWSDVASRLRPFLARQVAPADVDDVLQDVFVRMQRGLGSLREEERFTSWLFQVARSSVAEHGRARARHPLVRTPDVELAAPPGAGAGSGAGATGATGDDEDDDRQAARALSSCIALFVARLASPYREAITLVELEGLTAREAAEMVGVSVSGMKSRVQRGRAQLRALLEECCEIALDARGKVTDFSPRARPAPCPACK
jgi:RNA polymerase sigma-70 factor, ECF subfamily